MELHVTVQIDGEDVVAGRLYQQVRNGRETATFSYADSYLSHPRAFALAPDLPLLAGSFHSAGLTEFRAFEDCMPDRWGRNLMLRAERQAAHREGRTARTLFEADMLVGVSDETRQGAIRIWAGDPLRPVAPAAEGVPREVNIPHLVAAADAAATDMDADVRDLLAAGSSLGGARPKASVRDERGVLHIAKFPKADEDALEDVGAWEQVCLHLMERCGIRVPRSRLVRVAGRSVLLLERFDRDGARRIPYISGITAVQGADGGQYSLLELVEFLEEAGSAPADDIRELWRRALFGSAVGNTDNHMRNFGFLRDDAGWRLSPVFDVNPTPGDERKYVASPVDFDRHDADPSAVMEASPYYRYTVGRARSEARAMARVLAGWRAEARRCGIAEASIARMASCFTAGVERLAACAG